MPGKANRENKNNWYNSLGNSTVGGTLYRVLLFRETSVFLWAFVLRSSRLSRPSACMT